MFALKTLLYLSFYIRPILGLVSCNTSVLVKQVCNLYPNYVKGSTDYAFTGKPMTLATELSVVSITDFSEDSSTVIFHVAISSLWNDTRLTIKSSNDSMLINFWEKILTRISISDLFSVEKWYEMVDDANDIYVPILRVINVKKLKREDRYGAIDKDYFWLKYPHNLNYRQTITVQLHCSFNFHNFPFDSHACYFKLASAVATNNSIQFSKSLLDYQGQKEHYIFHEQDQLPFDILLEALEPSVLQEFGSWYPYAGMKVHMVRNSMGPLIGSFYLPSGTFAVLSTVSYSISVDNVILLERIFGPFYPNYI